MKGKESMNQIGDYLQGDPPGIETGIIIKIVTIDFVTFYVTQDYKAGVYRLFSHSKKQGLQERRNPIYSDGGYILEPEVMNRLAEEQVGLLSAMNKKAQGNPTPKQLSFLFANKIPIPVDLTFGQASELIEQQIAEDTKKRLENFKGLEVGMMVIDNNGHRGVIERLDQPNRKKYAYVRMADRVIKVDLDLDILHKDDKENVAAPD